jgi:uncharacterized protein
MTDRAVDSRLETYSGRRVDPFDVSPADVHLPDVAAALAHTCRFGGHCRQFYSVAQHCLHVSRELPTSEPRLQLYGLLHDAGEAYLGDVPRPIKARFDRFERGERRVLDAVWRSIDVEASIHLKDGSWAVDAPALPYDLRSTSIGDGREQFLDRAEALLERLD